MCLTDFGKYDKLKISKKERNNYQRKSTENLQNPCFFFFFLNS